MEYVAVMKGMGISTGPGSKVLQTFVSRGDVGEGSGRWDTVLSAERRTVPEDLCMLHPIEFFGDFTENGRLKSTQVCATDTPLQNKVKRANLTRQEIVVIIMYTGTVPHSELNLYRSNCTVINLSREKAF
jgi:hypothetical protein